MKTGWMMVGTLLAGALLAGQALAQAPTDRTYLFGHFPSPKLPLDGHYIVSEDSQYTAQTQYGINGDAPAAEKYSLGGKPFFFSVDAPEGNYKITVTFGGDEASDTTVRAELRRLMVEPVTVPAGKSVTKTFIVNVRTPNLPDGTQVQLKGPRESVQEGRAWDERITLEFDGKNPQVRTVVVDPIDVPTIYILGDSTSCDQMGEPYTSWGQMLTAFFKPTVAIANHGESGESVSASIARKRFDKILSLIKPGDYFIVQFGHNDMKEKAKDPDAPAKYKAGLIDWATKIKAKGATPIIVTSMNRRTFVDGKIVNSLEEYPQLAREAAKETGSVLIDLNASSAPLYESFGEDGSKVLFEHNEDFSKVDGTHHSAFGAYELAKLIVQGLKDNHVPVADQVVDGWKRFDPAHPDKLEDFKVPPSSSFATDKPFGS
ncbi:MAG TPA: rhamnogalacturonan acetylesterase [Asticcacaulis sp.]|nr:rhamnogalacturonan acetylesterase [Asticcacaulis sp.]